MIELFIPAYKQAAAEGAVLELKLRMLCEAVPGLQQYAHLHRLEDVEGAVIAHFDGHLASPDKELLVASRQLRNKVLHCDFHAAREKLRATGSEVARGSIRFAKFDSPETSQHLESIKRGDLEALPAVADTSSTKEGSVFGWLMELGTSGDLQRASATFARATAILGRLAMIYAQAEVADQRSDT